MKPSIFLAAVALACAPVAQLSARPAFVGFTDEQAVKAIVGEAANQGYLGMLAVACAIRNRGTLKGVVGLTRNIRRQPNWVYDKAREAWAKSLTCADITFGATHWENVRAFGMPEWADEMKMTTVIKDHYFFKAKGTK